MFRSDPMQDALQRQLGGTRPGVSTTMPVGRARSGAAPAGFDQRNWDNPEMRSVKYDAGAFLNGRRRPSEIGSIVSGADFQHRFPGATFDGKDRVNFAGALSDGASGVPVYEIDVLRSADKDADTSEGFWWGHDVPGMVTGSGGQSGAAGLLPMPGQQSDLMAQILEALQGQTAIDPQALLQQQLR